MKRDFSKPIQSLKGNPVPIYEMVPDGLGGEKRIAHELTFKTAAVEALGQLFQDEPPNHTEKLKRFRLALKLEESDGEVEVSAEEIVLIKHVVGKMFDPIIFGRMDQFLEDK